MSLNPLAAYLERHGISQGAFAKRLGVKSGVVCRWATGKRIPATPFANAIERETSGEVPARAWGAAPTPGPVPRSRRAPASRSAARTVPVR